jgi:NTE family protein
LTRFWDRVALRQEFPWTGPADAAFRFFDVICRGVPSFFQPDPLIAMFGVKADVGVARAAFYNVNPLMQTLTEMIDFGVLKEKHPRLTVGAVNVRSGEMRYFDSRDMDLTLDHVMASGALPPAFPAVTIDGESYWDGGIYSNTPLEAVFDDRPRRDSLIFAVNLWQPHGETPRSVWDVLGRQKDIQYSSRLKSHIERQDQIHRLRHIIRELGTRLSDDARADPIIREMVGYGCSTTMHLVGLLAPRLEGEDHTKDVDFSADGIRARRTKGHEDILRALERRPWECQVGPLQGVVVHEDGAHNFVVNHD